MLVGLAVMIATQLFDLCHEIPVFDSAFVESHMTDSSMYIPLSDLGENHHNMPT